MSGTHSKNDSDQTGSQPRSSFIVRSSVRSFGAHPPDGVVLFQVIYRLSSICHPTLPTLPTLPTAPGVYLPTNRTPVCRCSAIGEHEHERRGGLAVSAEHRVIMIRVRRRRAGGPGREREGEKARRPGRKEDGWRRRIRDEGEHRVDADASRTSRSGDR